jgi:hypothetical protein
VSFHHCLLTQNADYPRLLFLRVCDASNPAGSTNQHLGSTRTWLLAPSLCWLLVPGLCSRPLTSAVVRRRVGILVTRAHWHRAHTAHSTCVACTALSPLGWESMHPGQPPSEWAPSSVQLVLFYQHFCSFNGNWQEEALSSEALPIQAGR